MNLVDFEKVKLVALSLAAKDKILYLEDQRLLVVVPEIDEDEKDKLVFFILSIATRHFREESTTNKESSIVLFLRVEHLMYIISLDLKIPAPCLKAIIKETITDGVLGPRTAEWNFDGEWSFKAGSLHTVQSKVQILKMFDFSF